MCKMKREEKDPAPPVHPKDTAVFQMVILASKTD
jgi:hypothetical protein